MIDLIAAQAALEQESLDLGVKRYREERTKDETNTVPGKRLLIESLKPLTAAITEWVADVTSGRPTAHANLGYFLQDVDPVVAAYLTVRVVLNAMTRQQTLQMAGFTVATYIEEAVNFDALRDQDPKAYRQLQRKIRNTAAQGYRHVVMRKQQKYAGVRPIKWGRREKLRLGILLVDLMRTNVIVNGAPLFRQVLMSAGKHDTRYMLIPTESCARWLEVSHARCELLEPVHLPMVAAPLPWSSPTNGGYHTEQMRFPLVKTKGRKQYMEELAHCAMPKVYGAVNALQGTQWRINKAVLGVMRDAWEGNLQAGKLPPREPLPLPPDAPSDCTPEQLAANKANKARVHTENARLMSKRLAMGARLWIADKFAPYDAIYFPHALDWRGRAYPLASYLHPQADDTGKALLEFAEGVPLGENGAYWLAVHGANCYGVDKLAFDDRVQWVLDHQEDIIGSALEPLGPRGAFWTKTDEDPWRFLAFCFEWAGYVMGGCKDDFVSHTPVAFDGSCNGLQHYSMMLRDEVGGAATNLVPSEKPSDIYALVAARLEADVAVSPEPLAHVWRGRITRKIAKQPTMTMPYGAGQFGYRAQIMDAVQKITQDTGQNPIGAADPFAAAGFLAGRMKDALAGVVVKAAEAMEWLQVASRVAAEDGLPIRWEAPNGLPVVQDYREVIGERLSTEVLGQRIRLTLTREGDKLDKRRQAQGIAPNFVHSLDAAHMMETVRLGQEHGIAAFAMVHDSYGAHAGHADTLNVLLREAFVSMYTADVLGRFRSQLVEQLSPKLAAKIPPLPQFGSLDIEAVRDSQYFFA